MDPKIKWVTNEHERRQPCNALALESAFQSVFLSEADGAWYTSLKDGDAPTGPSGFHAALRGFEEFLQGHVCRLMMRGDFVPLFEALLLLVLAAPAKERQPILAEVLVFFRSDACLVWQLAHQCTRAVRRGWKRARRTGAGRLR